MSAPSRVQEWLRRAPDGPVRVLHAGEQAVYLDVAGRAVGVLGANAVRVPNGLRSVRSGSPHPVSAHLAAGVLHLAGIPVRVGRVVDVAVPRLHRVPKAADAATRSRDASGRPDALDLLLGASSSGDLGAAEVRRLIGSGPGLTPLGDDVVAGWLGAARALGVATPEVDEAVRTHAHRTTTLSATLLDCALHGEAVPELGAYLRALGTAAEDARAAALTGVGATSGAGLLSGARTALRQLTTRGELVA